MKTKFASKIVVLSVLLALMFSVVGTAPAKAAGIITHTEIVGRAVELIDLNTYPELAELIKDHRGVVNYGAMFPDWGYASKYQLMGDYENLTEIAHTETFINALSFHLKPAFIRMMSSEDDYPGMEDDHKAIAFLLGVISHKATDDPWHLDDGFEKTAVKNDGVTPITILVFDVLPATGVVELAVDHMAIHSPSVFSHGVDIIEWYLPKDAVRAAYYDMGKYVSDEILNTAISAQQAYKERIPYLADSVSTRLDLIWTRDNMFTYRPGGIDDSVEKTARAWERTWDWLGIHGVFFVKPDGMGDCTRWNEACTLQSALTNALSGDEIWVKKGIYKPTTDVADRAASFTLPAGVAIYGGFAGTETARGLRDPIHNITILSGDIDSNDVNTDGNNIAESYADIQGNNSYHVVTVAFAYGSTLNGFIITAGNANGDGCPGAGCGGGMINLGVNPTVTKVVFSGNAATNGGGMYNQFSNPIVANVTFSGNSANYYGGGMFNYTSSPMLTNTTFSGNSAVYEGGGMYNYIQSSPRLTNVTISGNLAQAGGGMSNSYSDAYVQNSIIWGNTPVYSQIFIVSEGSTYNIWMFNSVWEWGCPSNPFFIVCDNVIPSDPKLGTLGNYGGFTPTIPLLSESSAIDTGDPGYCPETDQRGVTRPQGINCDIGATETDTTPPYITGAPTIFPNIHGWYNTDVTVHFDAEDLQPGVATVTPDQTIIAEGAGLSVTGTAVDFDGNSASFTVEPINIDKTAPVVNVSVDKNRYTKTEPFIIHFNGLDALSGLNSLTAQFNGQPVLDGQSVDLFWLPLGNYTLTVRAEDLAGNVTEESQSIELYADIESLKATVARLCTEGYITKSGACNELSAKLDAATSAHNRGNDKTAINILNAFQNAVKAQMGKAIQEDAAQLLLLHSVYVTNELSQ